MNYLDFWHPLNPASPVSVYRTMYTDDTASTWGAVGAQAIGTLLGIALCLAVVLLIAWRHRR